MKQNFIKKIKKVLQSTYLCIRYPFLYPRNRFTGLHYNNWKLLQKIKSLQENLYDWFWISITSESKDLTTTGVKNDRLYEFVLDDNFIKLYKHCPKTKLVYSKPVSYFGNGVIKSCGFDNNEITIIVDENFQKNHKFNPIITVTHNKIKSLFINFLNWFHSHPLQIIHCLTSYTELDAMETGWRKAFGLEMCEEIKQSLLKTGGRKLLKRYRITEIKEKFGGLRWYDTGCTKEIADIIFKYEGISYKTCIHCGKPMKYISKGWISPYCENCAQPKDRFIEYKDSKSWSEALWH